MSRNAERLARTALNGALNPEVDDAKAAGIAIRLIETADPREQTSLELTTDLTPEQVDRLSYSELLRVAEAWDLGAHIFIDVNCQKLDGTVHQIVVPLGYYAWDETVITSTPKISGGKVTGYNLSGVVTSGPTAHTNPGKSLTSCPAGEVFHSWGGDTPGKWHYVPRAGSGILQVTIGNKTAALPNTPVPAPVV